MEYPTVSTRAQRSRLSRCRFLTGLTPKRRRKPATTVGVLVRHSPPAPMDALRGAERVGDNNDSLIVEGDAMRARVDDEDEDFGIAPGTLEVVSTSRRQWVHAYDPPLPVSSPDANPILHELSRGWRALRLKPAHVLDGVVKKRELSAEHSLLKNYEPRGATGEPTFPSEIAVPAYLQPRVAVEDAAAFVVTTRLRFALGMLEPFYCRLVVYDVQLGCRVSEEFAFTIPAGVSSQRTSMPRALFYSLPNHQQQHLYIVLKVSKGLLGDADAAIAPYCNPEKFASEADQQRLMERVADSSRRLGKYSQPLAWGALALAEAPNRSMTLYRQRTTIGDEQRIPMVVDAARSMLKEKITPAVCELDIERIDDARLDESKFQLKSLKTLSKDSLKLPSAPILDVLDPFSAQRPMDNSQQEGTENDQAELEPAFFECREVQPLCHPSTVSSFGLCGSGPVAVSYVHTMYVYPLRIERFPFRNVAVRVQLLEKEAEFVCGMDEFEAQNTVVKAFYGPEREMSASVFAHVNYHQKNPQFEKEIKVCLPEQLTASHHLLFTFFHVHCKKLHPSQQQQELVGCCALPILSRGGALVEDSEYALNVIPASVASKNSTSDGSKTIFSVRTRALSSVRSQDASTATLLEPFQSRPNKDFDAPNSDQVVMRLSQLRQAPSVMVRHIFLPVMRALLAYMRFTTMNVRQAAFRTLLSVFEKSSWSNQRSIRSHDSNVVLQDFVTLAFDDKVIESCASRITGCASKSPEWCPQSILQAIVVEWLRVLRDKSQTEDAVLAKRLSLCYSNIFLQLILKAMALQQPQKSASVLPLCAKREDDALIEDLLIELVENSTNQSNGLLIQKEVNVNVATFCKGLFLVSKSTLPIRVINYFLGWTQRLQRDVNVTVHILFPFINSLIEFEFFAIVNGFRKTSAIEQRGRRGAWLARLVFERLLKVVDEQVEDRIRSEALRLLRRMFVLQVYNPRHQNAEQQELIALMYFPMIPSMARFTTDGKLLAAGAALADTTDTPETDRSQVFRKELLICVAHLLSSVTLPYLSWYFRQSALVVGADTVERETAEISLSPTASLIHYRTLVEETKLHVSEGRRQSVIQRNLDKAFAVTDVQSRATVYDEIRVHACLSLLRQVIEIFLVDESSASSLSSLQVLSPDLVPRDRRISLLELEAHLKQRRSRRRGGSVGQDTPHQRASATSGSKSPNAKFGSSGGSFSAGHPPRLTSQKSMPRNWGKNYVAAQQRQSITSSGDATKSSSASGSGSKKNAEEQETADSTGDEYEINSRNLHLIVADTTLKAIRTAIDQFEWVIRIIETPLDYLTNSRRNNHNKITIDHAFTLLGSITDIFFLLMKRASSIECLCTASEGEIDEEIDEDSGCFLADLFRHLQAFLLRFQKALFATRIIGLPLIHDQSRIHLLVSLSAMAGVPSVRQHAASLLCRLMFVCYEQTGSFLLIKRPLLKVFCANFFSTSSLQIPPDALREVIELWRQQPIADSDNNQLAGPAFELQLAEMFNSLTSQIKVFETWHNVMTEPETPTDVEELEEGLYRIVQSVSSLWLLDVKTQWMDALIQLHATRKQFAEASCCTLEAIAFREEIERTSPDRVTIGNNSWLTAELRNARELAQKAGWMEKVVEVNERLLLTLRQRGSVGEYRETLRLLDSSVQQLGETIELHNTQLFAFYRVVFAGDCVPLSVSSHEYVYKRSKFISLGEFVGEMKGMLRTRFPSCERVDILPESKSTPSLERNPNVIFMRVTSLEQVHDSDERSRRASFRFSTPFTTNGGSAYGKTAEQMKRVVYLTMPRSFPCVTSRQVVAVRRELVRCPIENSMDDIRKRCGLLHDEIDKETRGRTDLKTLTLVLKGSVDTHVHGGIPEVIDAFLANDGNKCPNLLDTNGKVMDEAKATDKQEELADLIVEFLELCWTCLLISRLAFRRTSTNQPQQQTSTPCNSTESNGIAKRPSSAASDGSSILRSLASIGMVIVDDELSPSPLQVEFEKSFVILVDQMRTRVTFPYPSQSDLKALSDHVQRHSRPRASTVKNSTGSTTSALVLAPSPSLPPPQPAHPGLMLPPPAPVALTATPPLNATSS